MSELIVEWEASAAFRRQQAIATGQTPPQNLKTPLDLATMTQDQRAAILALASLNTNGVAILKVSPAHNEYGYQPLDAAPTPASLAIYCTQTVAARRALAIQNLTERIAECIAETEKHIAERNPASYISPRITEADAKRAGALDIPLDAYHAAEQQLAELRPIFAVEKAAAQAEADAQRAAADKAAADKAAAELAERIAWANANGTERLREGLAAGHRCDRLFEIERAAVDYPGFVVDWEKHAAWKDAICPALRELRERKALLAAHPDAEITIVWLTDEPLASKRSDEYDYEPFEEREAIVVDAPSYAKYLVK